MATEYGQSNLKSRNAMSARTARRAALLEITERLIRVPSFDPQGCANAIPDAIEFLRAAGFEISSGSVSGDGGAEVPFLLARLGEETLTPEVMLCVHIDTSPAGDGWTTDPYGVEIKDGRLFGRGAAVSKSSLGVFGIAGASAWKAARAANPDASVVVAVTCDEGSGGEFGARYLLETLNYRPKLAILPGAADAISIAHKGCVQMTANIVGASCHQSVLTQATDAMRAATEICASVYVLDDKLRAKAGDFASGTVGVNAVSAGTVFGMAPAIVDLAVDRRIAPDEDLEAAAEELRSILENSAKSESVNITTEIVRLVRPLRPSKNQHAFVTNLQTSARNVLGKELPVICSPLYTDARWFGKNAIPTVMYGPAESDVARSGANGGDESVRIDYLENATDVLERALTSWLRRRANVATGK